MANSLRLATRTHRHEQAVLFDTSERWQDWLLSRFPKAFQDKDGNTIPFAQFHAELWEWVWAMRPGVRQAPFIGIWARHGGKSTNAEFAVIAVGERKVRNYVLYISSTQDRADDHVRNIGMALESPQIHARFPELAERAVNKYGAAKGWRRNRLQTRSGFTVDALGLDTIARGAKVDEDRPDFIVLDDVDSEADSLLLVNKKINIITRAILPSGAHHVCILAVQNLIHEQSIFSRFVDGRANFLSDRYVSGPHKAIDQLTYEESDVLSTGGARACTITGGTATWEGLSLDRCQGIIDNIGISSFLIELQHERSPREGALLGAFWRDSIHIVEPFILPPGWTIDRSFDWGSSHPFAVLWWAESDGSPAPNGRHYKAGTLFVIHEWYGWNGKPNEGTHLLAKDMAIGIRTIERGKKWGVRVQDGPADNSIFDKTNGMCIARDMEEAVDADGKDCCVSWTRSDKNPGSRREGARLFREYLKAACQTPMDSPGLFVFAHCAQFQRTVPTIPVDPRNPEDAWTQSEDHMYDAARYRINYARPSMSAIDWTTRG